MGDCILNWMDPDGVIDVTMLSVSEKTSCKQCHCYDVLVICFVTDSLICYSMRCDG